jgi:uncharacterized protein YpmB
MIHIDKIVERDFELIFKKILKIIAIIFAIIIVTISAILFLMKPSNDRDWNTDQTILPNAEIKDNLVSIHNIRNFKYLS